MWTSIAAYHFTPVAEPRALADTLRDWAEEGRLLGTALVAGEGVNVFLAGGQGAIEGFVEHMRSMPGFVDIRVKTSTSAQAPFARLKVKVKREIIAFRHAHASPAQSRAPTVSPHDLARWIAQGCDDAGKPLRLLDTRNREEVTHGTFVGALTLPIDNFTHLPEALAPHRDALADATVVSFCTGGIRCEKAALWLRENGMDNVLQLDGGILGYFEAVGGQGFDGRCFVFDERIALDANLHAFADIEPQHPRCGGPSEPRHAHTNHAQVAA